MCNFYIRGIIPIPNPLLSNTMKTVLFPHALRLLLLLTLLVAASFARLANPVPEDPAIGIQFFKGSWSAVLAEAKKQNKPVFVDVYTT